VIVNTTGRSPVLSLEALGNHNRGGGNAIYDRASGHGAQARNRADGERTARHKSQFPNLLNIVPGTTRATSSTRSLQRQQLAAEEVNDQLRMGNNYQIDRHRRQRRTGLLQILVPPLEAIQTVDVSTSNFDAELGRASGPL